MNFAMIHPVAAVLTDSPAYRASRRRTAELLGDNRRLEFLQRLAGAGVALTDWEVGFLAGLMGRARRRRYHYEFSRRERAVADGLRRTHGGRV